MPPIPLSDEAAAEMVFVQEGLTRVVHRAPKDEACSDGGGCWT